MSKLNVGKIRALNEPGLFGDGGTLYLRVAPTGSKSWIQRLTIHGRRRDLGLGGYPLVSLAEARKLRQRIRAVLGWAQAQDYVARNVAAGNIDGALPATPRQPKKHFRELPYAEVPAALETIDGAGACLAARCCLRFVVLTACRSGEARGATWEEIDRDWRVWTVPKERMKNGKAWQVPLTGAARAVLDRVRVLGDGSGLVFPSPVRPGQPLSDMTLTRVLRDVGLAERATVHGMRSCFRTWAGDRTDAKFDVIEKCLAHGVGPGTERIYDKSTMLRKRRRLLKRWARFATGA